MINSISTNTAYRVMFRAYPEIVGIKEICNMLNISRTKAYQLVGDGKLQRIPCGREIKVAKITIINYVLQGAQK